MGTLLLELAGPLQSWGVNARFIWRTTRHEPTKSGLVGLLASALGRQREQSVDDLAALKMGVRIDQPGRFERDYQTMRLSEWDKKTQRWVQDTGKISYRYYLADAVFVAAIVADDQMLSTLEEALLHPAFPLFLGRRSCPPATRVLIGVRQDMDIREALAVEPWHASRSYRNALNRRGKQEFVTLDTLRDELPNDDPALIRETVRDVPLSFSQELRSYGWRTVVHDRVQVHVDDGRVHDDGRLLDTGDGRARNDGEEVMSATGREVPTLTDSGIPASHDPWSALER